MDITLLTPNDVGIIKESLDAIMAHLAMLFTGEFPKGAELVFASIGEEAKKIEEMFADTYYIFRCNGCERVYATSQSDLKMMRCCRNDRCDYYRKQGSMVFVEITTKRPGDAIVCGTF